MPGNILLKMSKSALESKYSGKTKKTNKSNKSRPKKVDSFHYWGPKVKQKDGQLIVDKEEVGKHSKDTLYYLSLGLPHEDAQLLSRVKHQARFLDGGYKIPIIKLKCGASAIIGLFPFGGDAIDGILAMAIVTQASRVSGGLEHKIRKKMVKNVILDIVIGLTPMLGDVADIFFRCSTKNANMLEEMLLNRVKHQAKAVRDAEKMGFATSQVPADLGGCYHAQAMPNVPPQHDNGHSGLRQRVPTQATQYQVRSTHTSDSDRGWFAKLKARAQDVGAMDDVVPVRRDTTFHNNERL